MLSFVSLLAHTTTLHWLIVPGTQQRSSFAQSSNKNSKTSGAAGHGFPMTEYWKNSPNYWCKHCAVFVRDTKLERQNHEATGRHQHAIKRSLRDLHRTHDREQRDRERARREIERLDGVVGGSKPGGEKPASSSSATTSASHGISSESALRQQREQLAQMGVSIPSAFLPDMAMPGEWTVTKERVIGEEGDGEAKERLAMGVRKRGGRGKEDEEQDVVGGLFKRPRRWGREKKTLEAGEDAELDALLRGGVRLKGEQQEQRGEEAGGLKNEDQDEDEDGDGRRGGGMARNEQGDAGGARARDEVVKGEEEGDGEEEIQQEAGGDVPVKNESGDEGSGIAPVVFKKRKPKGLRTRLAAYTH
ncbi:hypothetical protein E4U21_001482 [Claviceps maximensis]|nr:hypothetical protein E4U21_001482 [Claviceps maximensis]